jgi:hypothetical protein
MSSTSRRRKFANRGAKGNREAEFGEIDCRPRPFLLDMHGSLHRFFFNRNRRGKVPATNESRQQIYGQNCQARSGGLFLLRSKGVICPPRVLIRAFLTCAASRRFLRLARAVNFHVNSIDRHGCLRVGVRPRPSAFGFRTPSKRVNFAVGNDAIAGSGRHIGLHHEERPRQ